MPGKALVIMLLAQAAVIAILAVVLTRMEGHMIAAWGRGSQLHALPSSDLVAPGDAAG